MKIISMEPTPSPYSMKININQTLPDGQAENYKQSDDLENVPAYIQTLLQINGIKGLYRVIDFITVERDPRVSWEEILPHVAKALGTDEDTDKLFAHAVGGEEEDAFGEVKVDIQMIRQIPTQVKLRQGEEEKRFALPERMMTAAMEAASASNSYLLERKWVESGVRYGEIDEIGETVVAELEATYTPERLKALLQAAINEQPVAPPPTEKLTVDIFNEPDWRKRYAALAQMDDPDATDYDLLDKALDDEHASVRRIATAYLGMIEQKETLPYLYKALRDRAVNVRRTAGDCLSDLGFTEAMPEMIATLQDKSRIVRWRAAMFLYEVGDESAIPALKDALHDPEFEVSMQAKMALKRIESGASGAGSIWQQMERAIKDQE